MTEVIAEAFSYLPSELARVLANVHFFEGDPIFAGLHNKVSHDNRSFTETAHCCWYFQQETLPVCERVTTIVLPPREKNRGVRTVIHELGHYLDELDGFSWMAAPVNSYARTDRYEAFACAFESWVFEDDGIKKLHNTIRMFDQWATGERPR